MSIVNSLEHVICCNRQLILMISTYLMLIFLFDVSSYFFIIEDFNREQHKNGPKMQNLKKTVFYYFRHFLYLPNNIDQCFLTKSVSSFSVF